MEYIKNILKLRQEFNTTRQLVWFDVPQLHYPEWLNPKLMPEMVSVLEESIEFMEANKETMETAFKGFKDYEIARLDRDIAWMRDGQRLDSAYINKNKADFYRFFNEHDHRRGTDFLKTFPEMSTWWKECEYHARQS
jgi:hypothetical protein